MLGVGYHNRRCRRTGATPGIRKTLLHLLNLEIPFPYIVGALRSDLLKQRFQARGLIAQRFCRGLGGAKRTVETPCLSFQYGVLPFQLRHSSFQIVLFSVSLSTGGRRTAECVLWPRSALFPSASNPVSSTPESHAARRLAINRDASRSILLLYTNATANK